MDPAADEDRHKYFEGLAVAHVMGGLNDVDGRIFRSHLLECRHCRARVGELRAIAHDLADVERDERRVHAAKAIETKRRESDSDDEEGEEAEPRPRSSRVALLVGLAIAIVLVGWNVFLRTADQQQERIIDYLQTSNDLLVRGTLASPTWSNGEFGHPSQIRYGEDHVLVVFDQAQEGENYWVYQLDGDKQIVNAEPPRFVPGLPALPLLVERNAAAREVVVTRATGAPPTGDQPSGDVIVRALLGDA